MEKGEPLENTVVYLEEAIVWNGGQPQPNEAQALKRAHLTAGQLSKGEAVQTASLRNIIQSLKRVKVD